MNTNRIFLVILGFVLFSGVAYLGVTLPEANQSNQDTLSTNSEQTDTNEVAITSPTPTQTVAKRIPVKKTVVSVVTTPEPTKVIPTSPPASNQPTQAPAEHITYEAPTVTMTPSPTPQITQAPTPTPTPYSQSPEALKQHLDQCLLNAKINYDSQMGALNARGIAQSGQADQLISAYAATQQSCHNQFGK